MIVPPFQPPPDRSIRALVLAARRYLKTRDVVNPDWQAELICGNFLSLRRHELYLDTERRVTGGELAEIRTALTRRANGEPTQYILGETEFYGLPFTCDARALIPRPESERLVDLALAHLKSCPPAARVLDLGTGSGCIVVALAAHAEAVYVAADTRAEALVLARENAERNRVADRITFVQSDLFAGVEGPFALVVGNLPYVALGARASLQPEVRDFEPAHALFAGDDGLACLRRAIAEAPSHLAAGGLLLLEIGYDQAEAVRLLSDETGAYTAVTLHPDYEGHLRVLAARRK